MARKSNPSKSDSSAMKAMAAARAGELADPAAEARRHEGLFLKGVGAAQEELRWLIEHEAWRTLGFDSPVEWWNTRIRPTFVELEIRPAPTVARQILAAVEAHERGLPAAQRRTKKELAELALASDWVALGRRQDRSQMRPAAGADLGRASIVDAEVVDTHKQVGVQHGPETPNTDPEEPETPPSGSSTQTAAERGVVLVQPADGVEGEPDLPPVDTPAAVGGEEVRPPAAVTPLNPPTPVSSGIPDPPAPVSQGGQPIATPDGREPGFEPSVALQGSAAVGEPNADLGSPETGDGGDFGVAVSGQDLRGAARSGAARPGMAGLGLAGHGMGSMEEATRSATGEAPADLADPSVSGAGVTPSDVGEASGDETAEGSTSRESSAVDPEEPFTEWGDDLIDVIGRRPAAVEALDAPALYLAALWAQVDELTQWCDEVDRVRKGAAS